MDKEYISPCTFVLFGATGNLAKIKLFPGLLHLDLTNHLCPEFKILSVGRQDFSIESWRNYLRSILKTKISPENSALLESFLNRNFYFNNSENNLATFSKLQAVLSPETFPQNFAFFLSIRPTDFSSVVSLLSAVHLLKEDVFWRRVVIEKPFGVDLDSAQTLQTELSKHLTEDQIYRIDHYLGKNAVQNIFLQRFTNTLFESFWNKQHIEHIQIINSETLGVGDRISFYENTGALRDMLQSHLLQIMALVAMEKPESLSPQHIRQAKVDLLKSIRPVPIDRLTKYAFRAQYKNGVVDQNPVKGYLDEVGYTNSTTETYVALKLFVDTPRWHDVPFYIKTAKRLNNSATRIIIKLSSSSLITSCKQDVNYLIFEIQPNDHLEIKLQSKCPGFSLKTQTTILKTPPCVNHNIDAYEALLLHLMNGNNTYYLHIDEVLAQWELVDPVIKAWATDKTTLHQYSAGGTDPIESKIIFDRDSDFWYS